MAKPTRPEAPAVHSKPEWALTRREFERAWREARGLPRRRRRWPWLVVILVLAGGAYGWQRMELARKAAPVVEAPPPPEVVLRIAPVETVTLAPQTLQRTVRVIGTLNPIRQAQLPAQVNGKVESVAVEPGDAVRAGDVLVQIDVETLSLELAQAKSNMQATRAQLALARAQLDRVQALVDKGVTSASSLDEADSKVSQLMASASALEDQVSGAELRLRNATVTAPFDGVVSARAVDPGQYVQPGAALLTVVDLTRVEMRASAPVGAGALLRIGQPVTISVDGISGRTFAGSVMRLNPVADEGSRTLPVYIGIDNADGTLLGGMFAVGQIVVETAEGALAVPTDALREDAEGAYVLRIEDDHLRRTGIETDGEWGDRLTRITAGLAAGQVVVSAPLADLHDGDAVEIDAGAPALPGSTLPVVTTPPGTLAPVAPAPEAPAGEAPATKTGAAKPAAADPAETQTQAAQPPAAEPIGTGAPAPAPPAGDEG